MITVPIGNTGVFIRGIKFDANGLAPSNVITVTAGSTDGVVVEDCSIVNAAGSIGARVKDASRVWIRRCLFNTVATAIFTDGASKYVVYENNEIKNWTQRCIYTTHQSTDVTKVPSYVTMFKNTITDMAPGGTVRQPIVTEATDAWTTLNTDFPVAGATDLIAYSTDGVAEFSGLARTAVGATGWLAAAQTIGDEWTKANATTLTSATATVAGTVTHFAVYSNVGVQKVTWNLLPAPQVVAIGGTVAHAIGDLKIVRTGLIYVVNVIDNIVIGPSKAWTAADPGTADQISLHRCADYKVMGNTSKYGGDGGMAIGGNCVRGVVSGNVCSFNDVTGLFLGSSTSAVSEVTVTGNTFMNNGQARNGDRNDIDRTGIRTYGTSDCVISGNTLGDNQATKTQKYGISFNSSTNITVGANNDAGNALGMYTLDTGNTNILGIGAIQTVTSVASFVLNCTMYTKAKITAQAAALAIANPTGVPAAMQSFVLKLKDNGTARAITYGTQFRAIGVTLPTTTVVNKTMYLGFMWNTDDTKWDCIAVAQEV